MRSEYFSSALQAGGKLKIKTPCTNFQLDTVRRYLGDRQNAWGPLKSETKTYPDAECEFIFTLVFCKPSIPEDLEANVSIVGISREGRGCRWLSAYMLPEVDARLRCGPCKSRHEASAQSHILAGVESRATFDLYQFCKNLRGGEGSPSYRTLACNSTDLMW